METMQLKEEYKLNPNDEELLNRIKIHEEKYKWHRRPVCSSTK